MADALHDARFRYADRWHRSAESFFNEGHYDWMASFLKEHRVVLEIGTGTGHSTSSLVQHGHVVVSVDENAECLRRAEQLLLSKGHSCVLVLREEIDDTGDCYRIRYGEIDATLPDEGALLIQGDVLQDHSGKSCVDARLEAWIDHCLPFDAAVCWLIGSHEERARNLDVARWGLTSKNIGDYRLVIQNYVYELADRVLRPGGILHIVDRGLELTEARRVDLLRAHKSQASITSLNVVEELAQREYQEPGGGVPLEVTPGLSGRSAEMSRSFFTSVCALR